MALVWACSLVGFIVVWLAVRACVDARAHSAPARPVSPLRPLPLPRPAGEDVARALHPSAWTPPLGEARPTPSPIVSRRGLPVRLLFATADEADGLVVLDCVACADGWIGGPSPLCPGTPFAVKAELSCSAQWAVSMIESLLGRWTETGTPVQLAFLDGAGGLEVRLSDEDSRVQLPVAA